MTNKNPQPKSRRSKLKITHDVVVEVIVRIIETEGLEEARIQFKLLNNLFSTECGWAETAAEIHHIFAEVQKNLRIEQLEVELAKQRAGAPSIIMMNQNEANGVKDLKRVFNHDVTMTGKQAIYIEEKDDKYILVLQNWLERIRKEVTNKVLIIKRISDFLIFPILAQPTLKKI